MSNQHILHTAFTLNPTDIALGYFARPVVGGSTHYLS